MARDLKAVYAFLLMLFFVHSATAQLTQYAIGGPGNEIATKVKHLTSDGSTIIGGYTYNIVNGSTTNCQCILMKVTSSGVIAWQKTFGVPNTNNTIQDMIITQDGNIVVVGHVGRDNNNQYSGNIASILKFNATNGSLMWQQCFKDNTNTTGGEILEGVTELTDGTHRLVAVGADDFTPSGAASMICVFQSNGTLIYDEIHDITNGDEYRSVATSADGASVYICGEFVGDYKDGKVIKYTPGTTSGTVNWTQCLNYAALGSMVNNFLSDIQLANNTLVIATGNVIDYTGAGGEVNAIITMSATDGSGVNIKSIQNSNAAYGNDCAIASVSNDHVFMAQEPDNVSLGDAISTPGAIASSVITDITSLSSGTTNPPVKFVSSEAGEHSVLSLDLVGSNTLLLAGGTNVASGFGNNDIYYVQTNTSLASLNNNCDTAHDVVSITSATYTTSAPSYTLSTFTPTYSTVDTGSTNFNIGVLCGDADTSSHPCLTDTLIINTGYDPISNTAITPGSNGGTPVTDPHWIVSSISPDVATAIATYNPGYTEVTPGNSADVIQNVSGWANNPPGNPGGWISYLNSNQYYDDGNTSHVFNGTLNRSFRMCSNDTITISINIADDNYVSSVDIDGANLQFSQVPGVQSSNYTSFSPLVQTVYLTAGTHSLNIVLNNYAVSIPSYNPTGLNIYGTVSSATGSNSLVSEGSTACNNYVCNSTVDTGCNTLTLPDSLSTCPGGSVTLQAVVTGPDSVVGIAWSPSQGLSNPNILNPVCTPNSSTSYQVTVKAVKSNGDTCTVSGSVYIKVANLAPTITIQPSICAGQVSLTAHDMNNPSLPFYSWNFGDNSSDTGVNVTHVYADTGIYTVVLTESTASGCSDTVSITVHIAAFSTVKIIATGDTTICQGGKATLGASGGVTYTWAPLGTLNNGAIATPIAKPDTTTTYIVTGKDSSGCIGTDSATVAVLPAPALKIDSPQVVDCSNRSIQLNANGAMKYRWSPAADFSNPDIANPTVAPMLSTTYYLTGYNSAGCTVTDSVQVTVEQEGDVIMPNAFTPNNDGINDIIYPMAYCDFTFESFSIYNRWGQRVFFTNTYMKGWDGTFNGVPQPMDVFVYYVTGHITGTDKQIIRKGNITLIR